MKERWQTCFWLILRTIGIHFLRDFKREVVCGRLIDLPLAKHDTERWPLCCRQLLMADKRRARVVGGGCNDACTEGIKVTRFGFVQKRKKLNDNLLWAADATPTLTPKLATAVHSVCSLALASFSPRSPARSLAHVAFVGLCCLVLFVLPLLACLLLYNALLHAAHFTYFNHKCISYNDLFQFVFTVVTAANCFRLGIILLFALHAYPAWARI